MSLFKQLPPTVSKQLARRASVLMIKASKSLLATSNDENALSDSESSDEEEVTP